jgi:hypothetical protein
MSATLDVLLEKWDEVLESDRVESITDHYKKKVTAQLLENQQKALSEAGEPVTAVGDGTRVDNYDPILISLVRRMAPKLIAYDIVGVQPMQGPTGLIFAMKSTYESTKGSVTAGDEALHNEAKTEYSGKDDGTAHSGTDPLGTYTTGDPMSTQEAEGSDYWNEMSFTIDKTSVTAKSRQLKASYSMEIAQDLKAIHGLDAENELTSILSTEIITEINREVVRKLYFTATLGSAFATTPGTFDLNADADGRWSVEKFKGLIFAIERDANAIAIATRRGKGNFLVCSPDVASALALAGKLDSAPALANGLTVDPTGATFAGTMMQGRMRVYVDPYVTTDFYVVGYKGANAYDAGFFYCPYVPLQLVRAVNQDSFQPIVGFKTRYGMVPNPFVGDGTTIASRNNPYYRISKVDNLQ